MSILELKDVCYSYSAEKPVLRGCVIHTLCSDTLPLHADGAGGFGG